MNLLWEGHGSQGEGCKNISIDEEVLVSLEECNKWGVKVISACGCRGFVDLTKIPDGVIGGGSLGVAGPLRVVVLDDLRDPFRASMLKEDFRISRMAKGE